MVMLLLQSVEMIQMEQLLLTQNT